MESHRNCGTKYIIAWPRVCEAIRWSPWHVFLQSSVAHLGLGWMQDQHPASIRRPGMLQQTDPGSSRSLYAAPLTLTSQQLVWCPTPSPKIDKGVLHIFIYSCRKFVTNLMEYNQSMPVSSSLPLIGWDPPKIKICGSQTLLEFEVFGGDVTPQA